MCHQQVARLRKALACHPMSAFPILEAWWGHAGTMFCRVRGEQAQYITTWKSCDRMTCTCPDWGKYCEPGGLICKHCCSVVLEQAVFGDELELLLRVIRNSHRGACDDVDVRPEYGAEASKCGAEECCICYDGLGRVEDCHACPGCRVTVHAGCIRRCLQHDPRCPWCRGRTWDRLV